MYFISSNASLFHVYKVAPSGELTVVFGGTALCATPAPNDPFKDNCAATANVAQYNAVVTDQTGSLYVMQGLYPPFVIFRSDVSTSALAYTGVNGLPVQSQSFYVSNTGTQPLDLGGITLTGPFNQVPSGGNDCSGSTTLPSGASCQIGVSYLPTAVGTQPGTLTVSSNALNATNGTNVVALSGTAVQASSSVNLVATPSQPVVANLGQTVTLTATAVPQNLDTLVPTGTIVFMNGSTQLGTGNLVNGVATFSTGALAAGT
jgi:hypothetical protein